MNKKLAPVCFWGGILSIPLSIGFWFLAPDFGASTFDGIADATIREALRAAHAERWGIFVGLWPATLLIFSRILEGKE